MKKIGITLFLLACSMVMLTAQAYRHSKSESEFTLGAFGGLNIPKLTGGGGNPLTEGWSSRAGAAFGATFTWNMGQHIAWVADVCYSSEGGQRNGMQAFDGSSLDPQIPVGTYLYADFKNKSILNYVEVPIMAQYSISLNKSSKFYFDFGPYVGFILNAKQKTGGTSIVYADAAGTQPISIDPQTNQVVAVPFDANTDITNQINSVNFGLTGGIGIAHNIGFGAISLNVRGAFGLTNIQKNSQDGKNQTGSLLIALGYSIPL